MIANVATMIKYNRHAYTILYVSFLVIASVMIGLLGLELSSNQIVTIDNVQYVETNEHGMVAIHGQDFDVSFAGTFTKEYARYSIVVKKTPHVEITQKMTPVSLPNTSAPSGETVCNLTDNNGKVFTVRTSDPDCSNYK